MADAEGPQHDTDVEAQLDEAYLRNIVENIRDLLLTFGPDGRLLFANTAAKREIEEGMADRTELDVSSIFDDASLETWRAVLGRVLTANTPQEISMRLRDRPGRLVGEMIYYGSPETGTITCILSRADESNQPVHHTSTDMALLAVNELASSLTNQLMSIEQALSQEAELESTQRLVIQAAVEEMTDLLREVEALVPSPLLTPAPVHITEVLEIAVQRQIPALPPSVSLKCRINDDLWRVDGDAAQLEMAVTHLVSNAVEAVGETGQVNLMAVNVEIDQEQATAANVDAGRFVKITVQDNGEGIELELREQIFVPLFSTKRDTGPWRGLGLAQVQSIASRHKGFVHLRSERGRGSVFTLLLPRSASRMVKNAITTGTLPPSTFLVVDDEATLLDALERMLSSCGHRCYPMSFGHAAVEFFRDHAAGVDYVLLDIRLIDTTGPEVARRLLEIDPEAKIILTSGVQASSPRFANDSTSNFVFLKKPFSMPEIIRAVEELNAQASCS